MKRKIKFPERISFRKYQLDGVETAKRLIATEPDKWHLFSGPTGTGKSIFELLLLNEIEDSILITPRIEIIRDMLEKSGIFADTVDEIVTTGQQFGIYTPIRLRNILARGTLPLRPSVLIVDEAQHDLAETYQDIIMYLNYCGKIGATATPYRGTPKQTQKFMKQWNNKVHPLITLRDASTQKYISIPEPEIWPLVDDDEITVENNEFRSNSVTSFTFDRIKVIAECSRRFWDRYMQSWDIPTMFAVSTKEMVGRLVQCLREQGLPAFGVTQSTSKKARNDIFDATIGCRCGLVQIDVVSEGVDLPIRRLIDVKPTLSPVRWLQQIGRITRYSPDMLPHYVCCCRNLERHGYLMEGMIPNDKIVEAQESFNKPSKRSGMRAIGLENLGKFKPANVHCSNGITAFLYNLVQVQGYHRTEYCILVHPNSMETLKAMKTVPRNEDGTYDWKKARWTAINDIPDLTGFASAHTNQLTDNQAAWWKRDCETFGLNPHREVTNKNFQVLPLLADLSRQYGKVVRLS